MAQEDSLLLIKRQQASQRDFRIGLAGNSFRARPLAAGWHAASADGAGLNPGELWDLAHEAAAREPGTVAEPDLAQAWPWDRNPAGLLGARPGEQGKFDDQNPKFPVGSGFAWHLGSKFTQLADAQSEIAKLGAKRAAVRIGILDVGFDFAHQALPKAPLLRTDLAKNFVNDGQPPGDVRDPFKEGFLQNPGHGTGTLSILAGPNLANMLRPDQNGVTLGGNPFAEIIPCRIATSVVLLKTSAFAEALDYLVTQKVDVVSMSMGGVASGAWADVVNKAYEAGMVIVTAAGNNFGFPKSIVFPARFGRVLAACGVMQDGSPYDLPAGTMSGNFGPASKMKTALSAYTPNVPWAEVNAENIVDMDGAGTSAATPQIAAAAALWLNKFKNQLNYPQAWMVVEAVRNALFKGAAPPPNSDEEHFGQGLLRAKDALKIGPLAKPVQTKKDTAIFSIFRDITGLGAAAAPGRSDMLALETTQLFHRDPELEKIIPDPDDAASATPDKKLRLYQRLAESPYASRTLRAHYKSLVPASPGVAKRTATDPGERVRRTPKPETRRLRVYAFDPSLSTQLNTVRLNDACIEVPWEPLECGPVGEYIEVVDHDPASGGFYAPVDLQDRYLLASGGLAPSEGNPQFHQQMVYAVAMRTIRTFEQALGRFAMWAPKLEGTNDGHFIQRLRIYPHALRAQNAYYHPGKKALLFGYFPAVSNDPQHVLPGGVIFSCLSHDVVAHETTHALLDGMHRNFTRPSNPDLLAFHEAFADIVALFQHFSLPGVLEERIAENADPTQDDLLAGLAQEFGRGIGLHGALRSAIGDKPDPFALQKISEPHGRGAILVSAVFDAFLRIYHFRIRDLIRIATGGKETLPDGAINHDLARRLAQEASAAAEHVLEVCIRALDYCPPVDLTFGDYLRALITADVDVKPVDDSGYRVAFIEAFRNRGIFPRDVRSMSVESLMWRSPGGDLAAAKDSVSHRQAMLEQLGLKDLIRDFADNWPRFYTREPLFHYCRTIRAKVHDALDTARKKLGPDDLAKLAAASGLDPSQKFEVHAIRLAERRGTYERLVPRVILSIVQSKTVTMEGATFQFDGGVTLLINPRTLGVDYSVVKNVNSQRRQAEQRKFIEDPQASLQALYFGADPNRRFAMLHRLGGE